MAQVLGKLALLKPVRMQPRLDKVSVLRSGDAFDWIATGRRGLQGPTALDFETRGDWGNPASDAEGRSLTYPVGCAFSDVRGSCYVPFESPAAYQKLMRLLSSERVPLIAHNVFFDGGWPMRDFGIWLNWHACTYASLKLLATEGWDGQRWGLKDAQVNLLGWAESNEAELGEWLVGAGFRKGKSKTAKAGFHLAPEDGRFYRPDRGAMWRAPSAILGKYSALDADACWQLWEYVLAPALRKWRQYPGVSTYWDAYMPFTRTLIEARVRGMAVDALDLATYREELLCETAGASNLFLARPEVRSCVRALGESDAQALLGPEPPQWKPSPRLGRQPAPTKRDGSPSLAWAKWDAKRLCISQAQPESTARWLKWQAKGECLAAAAHSGQLFSLTSGTDRARLLYGQPPFGLGYTAESLTASGKEAVGKVALKACGEVGADLLKLDVGIKRAQFTTSVLGLLHPDGTLHPGFRVPATLTGRLGGSKPNIQQMPNDLRFLGAFKARPGFTLVAVDVVSLENYVLAELSRDSALLELYGPNARAGQDAYLFNGASLPVIGPRIRATGYDPYRATAEETAKAKKACKADRQVAKALTLAANYGAGVGKIFQTLASQGALVTYAEVQAMHSAFWQLYAGIKEWERELKRQWQLNGGWVLNGIGRPLGVDEKYLKDLVNRVCQSTGHDCFLLWTGFARDVLNEARLDWHPWLWDLHDACYIEVREDQAQRALDLLTGEAYDRLNTWLGGLIPLRGDGKIMQNWGEGVS